MRTTLLEIFARIAANPFVFTVVIMVVIIAMVMGTAQLMILIKWLNYHRV